jgi:hypothetical protein
MALAAGRKGGRRNNFRQALHRRCDALAADRDGGRFKRAVLLLVGGGDEDLGARLEFALVARHVGHNGRV